METEYKIVDGMAFHVDTCDEVVRVLCRMYNTRQRVKIIYGDTDTGKAWISEAEATKYGIRSDGEEGYVCRSTGVYKIPLAVYNTRSHGGGEILDHRIVCIETAKGSNVLYIHPTFHYKIDQD